MLLADLDGARGFLRSAKYRLLHFAGTYNNFSSVQWGAINRVVFVCKGNICRSVFGEFRARSVGLNATSCGLAANGRAPADPTAVEAAKRWGLDLDDHISKRLIDVPSTPGDLFLVMEPNQLAETIEHCRDFGGQVALLGIIGGGTHPYIQDPYGRSIQYFEKCFELIDLAVNRIRHETSISRTS